jgi:hypothetical protein
MSRNRNARWVVLVAANVAFWCVLSLQKSQGAGNQFTNGGGPSPAQQRAEIIAQLKEIKTGINILVQYRRNGALPETDPLQP